MSKSIKAFPNANQLSKLALAIVCVNSAIVAASPTGGVVNTGSASIDNTVPNTTTITQTTDVVSINWDTFNVGSDESVNFVQDSSDVAINNIYDSNASDIQGSITGNGTIFLSNTNGFIFGAGSTVNTGSFLATTLDIGIPDGTVDTIKLTTSADPSGSILINTAASITATGTPENGGYLAFISKSITSSSSLYSENSEVLLSNDVKTSVKLSGLDINFDANNEKNTVNSLNLEGSTISAKAVLLNSAELSGLLDSAINPPTSITADHLKISADSANEDISSSLYNAIDEYSTQNDNLSIQKLSLTDKSLDGHLEFSSNISIKDGIDLELSAKNISFVDGNLSGTESDVTLNGDIVNIGNFSDSFGSSNGLGSLTLNGNTAIQGSVNTIDDIVINGDTTLSFNDTTRFRSRDGSVTLNGSLKHSAGTGKLYIRSGGSMGIELGETTDFSEISLNASKLTLNGDIKATNAITINNIDAAKNTEIKINPDNTLGANSISIESNNISIEDFFFTSSNESNALNFNVIDNGSLTLSNSSIDENNTSNYLNTIYINNKNGIASELNPKVIIGGDFHTSNFIIGKNDESTNLYELSLSGNTTLNNIKILDLSKANLKDSSGNYALTATGLNDSTALFKNIENLNGLILSNFEEVTFTGDISTGELGLSVNATDDLLPLAGSEIFFDSSDNQTPIKISNDSGGKILLNASTSSNNNSKLIIEATNSNITLASIDNLTSLEITKVLDEGSTVFNGDIKVIDNITLDKLGEITINQDFTMATTSSDGSSEISLTESQLTANNADITLTSTSISADEIDGKNIDLNAENISLSGDINASGNLNLLSDTPNKIVDITLLDDISLSGNIDFLSSQNNTSNFIGANRHLDISASNSQIYMHTFDQNSELSSLSITSTNTADQVEIFFKKDAESKIILPTLNGIKGLSLLGNMNLNVNADQYFDTSSYDGQLDFSGVNMIGSGALTFDTGTGELSLGSFQSSSEEESFTALNILSSDKLNLHGELDIKTTEFNFSELNSIELHTDLTLGSPGTESPTTIDFGTATINGTHNLTLYTSGLTIGNIGNNIALQDLTIIDTSETLSLTNDISVVGTVDIQSNAIALANTISSSGLNVNISAVNDLTMSKGSKIIASYGDVNLNSALGNIGLGQLTAGKTVTIRSESGYLYNNLNNYISNTAPLPSTFTNITSTDQYLYGLTNIGESVSDPIVINAQNSGTITAESSGTIYIANLANAKVNATGRVIDGSTGGNTASVDAFSQFKLSSLNTVNLPTISSTLGLISNANWEVDENESIRKVKSPNSAPAIYYSRSGWRLGQK